MATQSGSVVIANGASLSGAAYVDGRLSAVRMPAAWTAANLTFQGSEDGTNYENLYDDTGTEVTATAAASRYISLDPSVFACVNYVKVRSGTSGTAVNQGAERTIVLVMRDH